MKFCSISEKFDLPIKFALSPAGCKNKIKLLFKKGTKAEARNYYENIYSFIKLQTNLYYAIDFKDYRKINSQPSSRVCNDICCMLTNPAEERTT